MTGIPVGVPARGRVCWRTHPGHARGLTPARGRADRHPEMSPDGPERGGESPLNGDGRQRGDRESLKYEREQEAPAHPGR